MKSRMDIVVQPGTKENIVDIVDFQIAMAMETERLELKREVVEKGVAKIIEEPSYGNYFLAFEPGKAEDGPIGSLLITREWSDWNNAEYWWFQSVYVKPGYRGRGVFKQMVACVEQLAMSRSVKSLRLYVDKQNDPAKACYQKLGLHPCHYSMYEKVLK